MQDYGISLHRHGVVLRSDRRVRIHEADGAVTLFKAKCRRGGRRETVAGFSRASRRRLEFLAANVATPLRCLITLTYHARMEDGEDEAHRNARIAARSKRDLNRFLTCMRSELGEYLWVREFQKRGVVHYHVLCEGTIDAERVSLAWCRSTDEEDDIDAILHAAQVEAIHAKRAVLAYVGRYLGKIDQKSLPPGVERSGRWWGRSRGLELEKLDEVPSCERRSLVPIAAGVRIVRGARRWLSRQLGWKFRGGAFVSWGDGLTGRLHAVVTDLRAFYGEPRRLRELLEERGWVELGEEEVAPCPSTVRKWVGIWNAFGSRRWRPGSRRWRRSGSHQPS